MYALRDGSKIRLVKTTKDEASHVGKDNQQGDKKMIF
jgi:hypothetical protein